MELQKVTGLRSTYQVSGFQKEFNKMTGEEDSNGRYHTWLRTKLLFLEKTGIQAIQHKDFEYLSGTNPKLYAIRNPHSNVNPRVVFAYIKGNVVCLLVPFKESSKKSNSEYDAAIKTATNRLKLINSEMLY